MSRLLQLSQTTIPYDNRRAVDQLVSRLGDTFTVEHRSIGIGGDYRNPLAALRALRALRRDRYDLIHAWDATSLLTAAMGSRARLVFTPPAQRLERTIHLLRAIAAYRPVEVVSPSATMDRILVQRGVAPHHCHLIRPAVDFGLLRRRKDPELRTALGLNEDDVVLLAAGESTPTAGHHIAVWANAILRVISPRFRLLLWGRGSELQRAVRLGQQLEPNAGLVVAEQRLGRPVSFESLTAVADIGLTTATGTVGPLATATLMAAGLPVVATATYATSELLEDHHTALMTPKPTARLIARRILELHEDASLQWRLADVARTEAYEYFSLSRFIDQHGTLYSQILANQPVHIDQPAPGAGLRFHGRA